MPVARILVRHFLLSPSFGRPGGGLFFANQICKTTPWVFTKGTGHLPRSSVPSFYPFRNHSCSKACKSGDAVVGGRRWRCFSWSPPPAPCFDPGGTPPSARFLPSSAEDGGVPPLSSGAFPVSPETRTMGDAARRPAHPSLELALLCTNPSEVGTTPHCFSCTSPGVSNSARGGVPFSPVAPGRRRRGFSNPSPFRRRLVIPGHDTQSPWDAEALVLECQPRASQLNTAPSLIVRRGGIPGFPPETDTLEGRACCPPEPFPRHRWLRASQSVRMAWPVAGDSTRREVHP